MKKLFGTKFSMKEIMLMVIGVSGFFLLIVYGTKIIKSSKIKYCGNIMISDNSILTQSGVFQCKESDGFYLCEIAKKDNIAGYFVFNKEKTFGFIGLDLTVLPQEQRKEICDQMGGQISNDVKGKFLCVKTEDIVPCSD